jgi:hypothetical protein
MALEVMMMERIEVPENGHQVTIDVEKLAPKTVVEWEGRPVAVILTMEEYVALRGWQEMEFEPMVEEPPRTPEGDLEALAAVERIRTMYPPLDEKTAQFIAESEELSLDCRFWLREGM